MQEDVIEKLGRFSPKAIDRDAMLFEAGRASVKPSRFWKLATVVLCCSQLLTLALWLRPRSETPTAAEPPVTVSEVPSPVPEPLPPPDPYSILALSRNPEVPSQGISQPGPSRPTLTAFTRNFQP